MDERYILINDIDETEARSMFAWINGLPEKANAVIEILSHGGLCFAGTGIAQKIIEAQCAEASRQPLSEKIRAPRFRMPCNCTQTAL